MTVPPPLIAANRVQLMTLIATNLFGQNTPAIMATEAEYSEMWAQDATAMYSYAANSAAASAFKVFTLAAADDQSWRPRRAGRRGRPGGRRRDGRQGAGHVGALDFLGAPGPAESGDARIVVERWNRCVTGVVGRSVPD